MTASRKDHLNAIYLNEARYGGINAIPPDVLKQIVAISPDGDNADAITDSEARALKYMVANHFSFGDMEANLHRSNSWLKPRVDKIKRDMGIK